MKKNGMSWREVDTVYRGCGSGSGSDVVQWCISQIHSS